MAKEKVIALYGAGWLAQQISKNLQGVTVFIEDNCPKDKMINQRHVYSPEEFKQRYVNHSGIIYMCICQPKVCTYQLVQKARSLFGENFSVSSFTELMFTEHILFTNGFLYWSKDMASRDLTLFYKVISNKIKDPQGQYYLDNFIKCQQVGLRSENLFCEQNYDFMMDRLNSENLHFIDCGAYDGDTVLQFIKNISKLRKTNVEVTAVEPDKSNIRKMENAFIAEAECLQNAKVEVLNAAIARKNGIGFFDANGDMSSQLNKNGTELVNTKTLSSLINKSNTLVKLDIEGAELEALSEAQPSIERFKPMLAISIYHNPSDLADIFNLIVSFDVHYEFNFRIHGMNGTDAMLYCY